MHEARDFSRTRTQARLPPNRTAALALSSLVGGRCTAVDCHGNSLVLPVADRRSPPASKMRRTPCSSLSASDNSITAEVFVLLSREAACVAGTNSRELRTLFRLLKLACASPEMKDCVKICLHLWGQSLAKIDATGSTDGARSTA